ncbi:MAG TPA: MFS transporter [Thermomicrobiales bacterium]|nr:MFS transporter [Thermomicrobiales bacterium]
MSGRWSREHLRVGIFLLGSGTSVLGNVMAMVALPWFVLQTTGSAAQTGLTGMASVLPAFLAGIFGGALVDRLGGRLMSVISDVVSSLAILAIPILYQTIGLSFTQLLILVFLGALLDIPGLTARRTLLPRFSKSADIRPEAMNSAFEVIAGAAGILGPAVAGILIAPFGAVNLLWITGAGFLLSAAAVYGVVPSDRPEIAEPFRLRKYFQEIQEGFAFLKQDALLLTMAIQFAVNNFVTNGFYGVGLPVLVFHRYGDASRLGLLVGIVGAGSLAGASLYGMYGHLLRRNRRRLYLATVVPQPLFMLAFVVDVPFVIVIASAILIGVTGGVIGPLSITIRMERIPERLLGRVFATFSAITAVIAPLGMIGMGLLIDQVGITWSMFVATCFYLGLSIVLPFMRSYYEMNLPVEQAAVNPVLAD